MEVTWILCFSLIIPFLFLFLRHQNKTKNQKKHPPGPQGLPLIGNLHQFDPEKPHEYLRNLSRKYGPLLSLKLGNHPVLVISSAKAAKEALKTNDLAFSGRPKRTSDWKYSYGGLDVGFSPFGEHWREMRKFSVVHLFSTKSVQSFRPILEEEVCLLVKQISNLSNGSEVINISSLALDLTTTVICRISFGKKYDERDPAQKKRFDRILRECQNMFSAFFVSDFIPSLWWIDKLSGTLSRLEKNFLEFDLFYEELIQDHLNPNRPELLNEDVLDLLIDIKEKQLLPFEFTWNHIKALLMDLLTAGIDANADVISWVMTSLIRNPSSMKKVQAEIRNLVGKEGITEEVLQQLPYLDAVIKETFRLYPPGPILLPRETIQDINLEGYHIAEKTMVFINAWAIGRDPENWENPDDFIPERFLNSDIDVKGNDFQLIPFGSGRRGCPGASLALLIVKVALANLLYSFDWKPPSGMKPENIDTETLPGLTIQRKNPLCLAAKKVSN